MFLCASIQLNAFPHANETTIIPKRLCMGRSKIFKNNNIKFKSRKQGKESSSRTDVSFSFSILCLKYILSHSSLNQDNNPSCPAFCDNNSFNPFLPVGTGNNPTFSASHHTKHVPFSASKVQNFSPHHVHNPGMPEAWTTTNPGQNPHLSYLWKWNSDKIQTCS